VHLGSLSLILHNPLDTLDSPRAPVFHMASLGRFGLRSRTKHVHLILFRNCRRLEHFHVFDLLFGVAVDASLVHVGGYVDLLL
jgi:hypothetical protein